MNISTMSAFDPCLSSGLHSFQCVQSLGGLGDIRKTGSGNMARQMFCARQQLLAALTLLADAAKGSAAIFVAFEFIGFQPLIGPD